MIKRILSWLANIVFLLVFLTPSISMSAQERRIALVIGNGTYKSSPLRNPLNDANDMAVVLKKLGFNVTLKTNADQRTMEGSIRTFGKELRSGGIGLFYYAGHGLQVDGRNYLIPIGADLESEADVKYESVDAGRVLAQMENAENSLNIIILDACRDNPFTRSFRSGQKGLAKMDAPAGSILAYSTAPGSIAADGVGRNGLYTSYLLMNMMTPGLKLEDMFKIVRRGVSKESGKKQIPWESSSLMGDFYFSTKKRGVSVVAAPAAKTPYNEADTGLVTERKQLDQERMELERLKMEIEREKLDAERKQIEAEKQKLKIAKLKKPKLPTFVGFWHWEVASPFVADRTNRINADGTCKLNKLTGSWRVSDTDKRKIVFSWSDNWTHTMILSKDGKSMSGKDDWGTRVTGKKMN